MTQILRILAIAGLAPLLSCSDTSNVASLDLSQQFFDTSFVLTDAAGEAQTLFRHGEDIYFSYALTNKDNVARDYVIQDAGPLLTFEVLRSGERVGSSDDGLAYIQILVDSTLRANGSFSQTYNWLSSLPHDILPEGRYTARAQLRLQFREVPTPQPRTLSFEIRCDGPCDTLKSVRLSDWPPEAIPLDHFQLHEVSVSGDTLAMDLSNSGGCLEHDYDLFMSPDVFMESFPVQANLYLRHDDLDDPCDAFPRSVQYFDLRPIADRYLFFYGQRDDIILNVFEYFSTRPGASQSVTYSPSD